jgi:ABC-type glycerol-3-phosphate transport system substrate-binding protein
MSNPHTVVAAVPSPSFPSRRQFLGLAGAAAATGVASPLLSASGTRGFGTKQTSNTLTIMASAVPGEEQLAQWKKFAVDPFGVELKFVTVADGTFPSQELAAQQAGNPPDIVQWITRGAPVLKASGLALEPLDSTISASENKADFYPQDYGSGTSRCRGCLGQSAARRPVGDRFHRVSVLQRPGLPRPR